MKVRDRFDKNRIGDLVCDGAYKYVQNFAVEIDGERVAEYDSLDGVTEEWEDYAPVEPLIKDEKIRKAVRAWAEANNANVVYICALAGGWGVRYDWEDDGIYSIDLLFKGNAPLGVGNQYTIDELCGTPPEPLEPTFVDLDERIREKEEE